MTCVCAYSAYMKLNSQLYPECIICIYIIKYIIYLIVQCKYTIIPHNATAWSVCIVALLAKPKPCPFSSAVCIKNHPLVVNCFGTAL